MQPWKHELGELAVRQARLRRVVVAVQSTLAAVLRASSTRAKVRAMIQGNRNPPVIATAPRCPEGDGDPLFLRRCRTLEGLGAKRGAQGSAWHEALRKFVFSHAWRPGNGRGGITWLQLLVIFECPMRANVPDASKYVGYHGLRPLDSIRGVLKVFQKGLPRPPQGGGTPGRGQGSPECDNGGPPPVPIGFPR